MKHILYVLCCFLGLAAVPSNVTAGRFFSAGDIDFELFINDRFHFFNNFFDSGARKFNQDRDLHILYVNPSLAAPLGPRMQAVFEIEAELLLDFHGQDFEDDMEVRNAYIQTLLPHWDWIILTAGRQAITTMDGLIYDDESPAFRIQADLERGFDWPFSFQALAAEVEQDSVYFHTDLKYSPGFFESLTLSYGFFRDTENGVARIFNYLEQQRIYNSRGHIQWFGVSLRKFIGSVYVRASGIFEKGSVRLRSSENGTRAMSTRGYMFDVNCDYSFNKLFSVSLFFYLASGDSRPESGTLRSFLSIDPYVDKTNIFFNGGIDSQYSADNVGLNGVQLPGVMAPGLAMDFRFGNKAFVRGVFAYLLTHKGTGGNGHDYGWEADIMAYYNIGETLQLFTEINVLGPGDYFREHTGRRDHISTECIVGLNYFFSN